ARTRLDRRSGDRQLVAQELDKQGARIDGGTLRLAVDGERKLDGHGFLLRVGAVALLAEMPMRTARILTRKRTTSAAEGRRGWRAATFEAILAFPGKHGRSSRHAALQPIPRRD